MSDPLTHREQVPVRGGAAAALRFAEADARGRRGLVHTALEGAMTALRAADPRAQLAATPYGLAPILILATVGLVFSLELDFNQVFQPIQRIDLDLDIFTQRAAGVLVTFLVLPFTFLMGWLADRWNRVWMLRAGTLIGQCAGFALAAAHGPGLWATSLLIAGVGSAIAGPVTNPLISDYYPPRVRARAFAFVSVAGSLSGLIGYLVAGLAGQFVSWRVVVATMSALMIVSSLLYFRLREPVRGGLESSSESALESTSAATPQRALSFMEGLRTIAGTRTLMRGYLIVPFAWASGFGVQFLLTQYLYSQFRLGPGSLAAVNAVGVLGNLAGAFLGAPVADRLLGRQPARLMGILALAGLLNPIGWAVALLAPNVWVYALYTFIPWFVFGATGPIQLAVQSLVTPARVRSQSFMFNGPFLFIGFALATIPLAAAASGGLPAGVLAAVPFSLVAIALAYSQSFTVADDIRAAEAANRAADDVAVARESGRAKILVTRGLELALGGSTILRGVDLDVHEGECLALLGTNGAGKSTLMRVIAGVEHASNGAIFLDGDDITHAPAQQNARRGIVLVPGGRAVFPSLTVAENLAAATWMQRRDRDRVIRRTESVLEMFPVLRTRLEEPAGNLSGGEQQMLSLGQAFVMEPRLLMIDELTLGLAPQVVEKLLEIVRRINAEGTAVLLVEQSVNLVLTVATRAVFMERGVVRFDGPTAELMANPDLVRSVFIGGARATSSLGARTRPAGRSTAAPAHDVPPLLEVENVSVAFGGVRALESVSFALEEGRVLGLIGPNGAGKSTLSDAIAGYVPRHQLEGRIRIEGRDVTALAPDARARLGVGRSFQQVLLFPQLTVRENIAVACETRLAAQSATESGAALLAGPLATAVMSALWLPPVRGEERRIRRRVDNLVEALGLQEYCDRFLSELSTGSRRVVDIACQLAASPRLLLLDEPAGGLAQAEAEEIGPLVRRIRAELGCAVILIEHDVQLIASVADRMIAMDLGRVIADGTPEAVLASDAVRTAYLGTDPDMLTRSGRPLAGVS